MNVLIVEDDDYKLSDLEVIVKSKVAGANIQTALSVASAISSINELAFDLIILDMALPSHPIVQGEGSPISLLTGGLEILFELHSMNRNDKCIIVTQYPEIEIAGKFYPIMSAREAIKQQYSCEVIDCVQYSGSNPEWKDTLSGLLKTI